jgi:AraC family carnitine catabolism transcriptional activator
MSQPRIDNAQHSVALLIGNEPSLHSTLLSIEPFRAANRISSSTPFHIDFLAADPNLKPSSMDMNFPLTATFSEERKYDLVIVLISFGLAPAAKRDVFKWLRKQAASGAHLCGADAGALLLAEAGLLDGYDATSHWSTISSLRELAPNSRVIEQLFVIDRNRSTCAGQLAVLDYSLEMVRLMAGDVLHQLVCNELIYTTPRPAEAGQREIVNQQSWQASPILITARKIMQDTVENPLSVKTLARRCGVSVRDLQYLFRRYLNTTPKRTYISLQLQRAQELLFYSALSVREIGIASGFSSPSSFHRAFTAFYNKSPQQYRTDFMTSHAAIYGRKLY